jgi:hypothetical protein
MECCICFNNIVYSHMAYLLLMKKHFFTFLFLCSAMGAYAQDPPRPTVYGLPEGPLVVAQLRDSIDRCSPQSFIKVQNGVVLEYFIVFMPAQGNGYSTWIKGKAITRDLKAILKKASPGDQFFVSNVKAFYQGKEIIIKPGSRYLLQ